jgi:hypothetical protein
MVDRWLIRFFSVVTAATITACLNFKVRGLL